MLWKIWSRIREVYDWAERIHFWPLVWKFIKEGYGWITGGGLLMTVAAALADMSGFTILSAGLGGVVAMGVITIAWRMLHLSRPLPEATTARPSAFDWKAAPEAIEAFADPALLAERDKQASQLERSMLRRIDAQQKIDDILKALPSHQATEGSEEFKQIECQNWNINANSNIERMTEPYLRKAWDKLREDLHKKLINHTLVAKGFREPHVAGNAEVEISSAEWRILVLDNVDSRALRKSDHEVVYSGLLIGQKLQ